MSEMGLARAGGSVEDEMEEGYGISWQLIVRTSISRLVTAR
jgi:hypothetical protein